LDREHKVERRFGASQTRQPRASSLAFALVRRPHWTLSPGTDIAINAVFFAGALLALGYAIHVARTEKKRWPIYLFLAGGVCIFYEVIGDLLGEATYGERHIPYIYHLWGRYIPVYDVGVYFFYFGIVAVFFMRMMERGLRRAEWWKLFAGHVVFCALFEQIPIHIGMWRYWGDNQPFSVFGFPAWWWFANSNMILNATAATYLLRRHLITDRQTWLLLIAYPMAVVGTHASAALPVALALNSTHNRIITNVCALLTIGLSVLYTWIFGQALALSQRVTAATPAPVAGAASIAEPAFAPSPA
jgi:hypothetical protein